MTKSTGYYPSIGIECHVQLKTKTKLFAAVNNDARAAEPNTLVSPVCFGLPGVLPVLNQAALELAIRAGVALKAQINEVSVFDRKHYFYPDLPKGYQISQFHRPIVGEGWVEVPIEGQETIKVKIIRAHLEEDAGKLIHQPGSDQSLVDLNRAGTPLLEIVSAPDIHSPTEAKTYAQELYNLMVYAGVTDGDLYHGNMRFDVNVSLSPAGSSKLGTRAEIKNINSFKAVERAVEYEIQRQAEILDSGGTVVQETRGWDEAKQKTVSQRSKEEAHDYRYFPDPDIPPIKLSKAEIEKVRKDMPPMPSQIRQKFAEAGLNQSQINLLINKPVLGELLIELTETSSPEVVKRSANLLGDVVAAYLSANEQTDLRFSLTAPDLEAVVDMLVKGQINSNGADKLVLELLKTDSHATDLANQLGLIQISNSGELKQIVSQVIKDNLVAAQNYKSGQTKTLGFLIGQVMAKTSGRADPKLTKQLIDEEIGV